MTHSFEARRWYQNQVRIFPINVLNGMDDGRFKTFCLDFGDAILVNVEDTGMQSFGARFDIPFRIFEHTAFAENLQVVLSEFGFT